MENDDRDRFSGLIEQAYQLGASGAAVIDTTQICVEDSLANLCRPPQCEDYGLSAGCPPHVSGPSGFRELLKGFERALVFKIDVPSESLFSSEYGDWFRLLHQMAAGMERSAVQAGFGASRAFAGGSCKRLFCADHAHCRVVGEGGECRHPESARPSMSGFGINASKLMEAAGWSLELCGEQTPGGTPMATICGLVLLG
jgi:predicted metal-binding protein